MALAFNNAARNMAMAGMLGALSALAFTPAANAETQGASCSPLYTTSTGREISAPLSAFQYSKRYVGSVGISIVPGQDLGRYKPEQVGAYLVGELQKKGIGAQCFVHNEISPNGTSINYDINGISWDEQNGLNISQALDDNTIMGVAGEANMVKAKLNNKNMHRDF